MSRALQVIRNLVGDVGEQRLLRRAATLPSEDLVSWVEVNISGIGKAFGDWQREGLPDGLEEARVGAASLVVVLEELSARKVSGRL